MNIDRLGEYHINKNTDSIFPWLCSYNYLYHMEQFFCNILIYYFYIRINQNYINV